MQSYRYEFIGLFLLLFIFSSIIAYSQKIGDTPFSVSQDSILLDQYIYNRLDFSGGFEYDNLLLKVRERGKIPVIVRLDITFTPEGLLDPVGRQVQRENILNTQTALHNDLANLNVKAVKTYKYIPYIAMQIDEEALLHLMENPNVIDIVEDEPIQLSLKQTIPLIGADNAWSAGYTGAGFIIAIFDTGVDLDHSFFMGKIVDGACFSSNVPAQNVESLCPDGSEEQYGIAAGDNCDVSISGCFHGTHVAGIAAGSGTSPQGDISGVARDAGIISVQVFSKFNNADECSPDPAPCLRSYTSDQLKAFEWIYDIRNSYSIASVNLSLGGGRHTSPCDFSVLKPAIDNLRSVNIATVTASGNDGFTNAISSPACISTAVSVGSTTKSDAISSFSNSATFLDLLAPGTSIYSAIPGGGFASASGTSMATPHVAGAWAVIREFDPGSGVGEVLHLLSSTGVPILDTRNNITKPRIQVDEAVDGKPTEPPKIAVSPESFTEQVNVGETINRSLTISNLGESNLSFNLSGQLNSTPTGILIAPRSGSSLNKRITQSDMSSHLTQSTILRHNLKSMSIGEPIPFSASPSQTEGILWIHYDGTPFTAIGLENGGTFTAASRFTSDELGDYYNDWALSKVMIFTNDLPSEKILKIWEGGSFANPGTLIYEQDITNNVDESSWAEITLTQPIALQPGNEYWVGYTVTHASGDFPTGCDQGPMAAGKGGWVSGGDGTGDWDQLSDLGLDYNWNIRAGIVSLDMAAWIVFDPVSGIVGPGDHFNVVVTFDATNLEAGVYYANIIVVSNDPETPNFIVPVELTVGEILPPEIAVSPESFEEEINVGETITRTLTISNLGESNLTFDLSYQQSGAPGGIQIAGIDKESALHKNRQLPAMTVQQTQGILMPQSLQNVRIAGVTLSSTVAPQTEDIAWVHYDGEPFDAIGLTNGGIFTAASRFTSDELGDYYNDWALSKVMIFTNDLPSEKILKIWEGGSFANPGTLIYEQDITNNVDESSWAEITLTQPIALQPGNEYWVGYTVTHASGDFPAGCDQGPMITGKGGWISVSAGIGTWTQLKLVNADLDFNWNIRAGLTPLDMAEWITFNPQSDIVGPSDHFNVVVTFDATNLEAGVYYANIIVASNDPATPNVSVPVELTVLPPPLPDQLVLAYPGDGEIVEVPDDKIEVILVWHASQSSVNKYHLDIARDANFTDIVITNDELTDTIYAFTSIDDNQTYYWRVRAENETGWGLYSEVWAFTILLVGVEEYGGLPEVYSLMQNFPNPFNPSTVIRYGLPERSSVKIEVYDILGQRVETLVNNELEAGYHEVVWHSGSIASGVYFCRIEAISSHNSSNKFRKVMSMVLVK